MLQIDQNLPADDVQTLSKLFLSMNNHEKMTNFLQGLFTPKEIKEFTTRLQIIEQLKQGQAQHQIASNLGVGVATVTRGSKELQKGNFKYV